MPIGKLLLIMRFERTRQGCRDTSNATADAVWAPMSKKTASNTCSIALLGIQAVALAGKSGCGTSGGIHTGAFNAKSSIAALYTWRR